MPILFALVSLVLAVRFFRQHPFLAILGSAVVIFVFYVVMPANNPSAARFGNLDPTQEVDSPAVVPIPVRRAVPVEDQPIPVRRALPVR